MNIIRKIDAKKVPPKKYFPILIGAMVLIISGILVGKNESKQAEPAAYRRVRSFTVTSASSNTADARTESNLGFRVPGKITAKLVKEREHVSQGQALMRLDPTELTLALAASKEAVTAAGPKTGKLWPMNAACTTF